MNVMFVTTLAIGYLAILVYLFIVIMLPFLYLKQRAELSAAKAERQGKIDALIATLRRTPYQDATVRGECALCDMLTGV